MPYCSTCGQKLEENAKFCSRCGASLSLIQTPTRTLEQRKTSYDGKILKCPSCGEILSSFSTHCPTCGLELRGLSASSCVKELIDKLEEIENQRTEQSWSEILKQKIGGKMLSPVAEKKINVIKNFPIPNTKEDIQEFIILATANMKFDAYTSSKAERIEQEAIAEAWRVKYNQAVKKAEYTFSNDEVCNLSICRKSKTKGWQSWNIIQKTLWVILNIYTIGIPALIYAARRK